MYLITIEGGDGSGKGLATKIVAEILEKEFTFTSVEITGEPRRDHPLGRLAIDAVKHKTLTPEEEAGLFAADRIDHSHSWILPRLQEGRAVVSERNVHSSIVYQGIVGKLGVEKVAQINSAALIPDLCIWVDCDPKVALKRIESGTLRNLSDKSEYFETSELQTKIRSGYQKLLSGNMGMPVPFDMGALIGPILNESSVSEFRKQLSLVVKNFIHSKPNPINVNIHNVDLYCLKNLVDSMEGQAILEGIGLSPLRDDKNWLGNKKPWEILNNIQNEHNSILSKLIDDPKNPSPKNILNHSISSICGTLSLLNPTDISGIRSAMGPIRNVSASHTRKIVRFLCDESSWIFQNSALLSKEKSTSQLKNDYFHFGRLILVIWPIRSEINKWQRENTQSSLIDCMSELIQIKDNDILLEYVIDRINIVGPGNLKFKEISTKQELVKWWKGN